MEDKGPLLLPLEIIDAILSMANEDEARLKYGPRSVLEAAKEIALKSSFRTPFIRSVHNAAKMHDHWLALKCWLMFQRDTKEHIGFDFEIALHKTNQTIHLYSVNVNRNPMPNGRIVNEFFIGDAYVFLVGGDIGVVYEEKIYRICAIYVPGYKNDDAGGSMTFDAPRNDDVLKMQGHLLGKYNGKFVPSLRRNELE